MPKVLIAEDDIFLANMYRVKLEQNGAESVILTTCEGIVEKVKSEKPEVIILDLVMPKISGFDALKMLKNDPLTKKIPVVVVTSLSDEKDNKKCIDLGAEQFIVKSDLSFVDVIEVLKPYIKV